MIEVSLQVEAVKEAVVDLTPEVEEVIVEDQREAEEIVDVEATRDTEVTHLRIEEVVLSGD